MFFVFIGRDKENMTAIRQATRPAHRAYIYGHHGHVRLVYGAPLANEAGEMAGTMLLIEAPDSVAAQAFIAGDPYQKADLFASASLQALHEAAPEPQFKVAE